MLTYADVCSTLEWSKPQAKIFAELKKKTKIFAKIFAETR
jgi:hypothetical protein